MLNFLMVVTGCNMLMLNTSNWIDTYSCNKYGFLKMTIKFIKNREGIPLNVVFYVPYTWDHLMNNIQTLKSMATK